MSLSTSSAVWGLANPSRSSPQQALAAACLIACCIVAPLEQLDVFAPQEIGAVAWLPLLRGYLLELKHTRDMLRIYASLQGLTALQSLTAASIACAPTAELPPALTRLSFGTRWLSRPDWGTPKQVNGWASGWLAGGWVRVHREA